MKFGKVLGVRTPAEPWTISDACDAWLAASGLTSTRDLGVVVAGWSQAVAPEVAQHVQPVALANGELLLAVDHPGWVTEMTFLGPDILTSLEAHVGRPVATRIKVTVRR